MQVWRKNYNAKNRTKKSQRDMDRRREARTYTDAIKVATPCADCGRHFPAVCMDFDHVRGGKVKAVASFVSGAYRLELIKEEIAKCELVCACCHRLRTQKRGENNAPSANKR